MSEIDRAIRELLEEHGLHGGTSLENKMTCRLHRWGLLDKCQHQYRVGKYRLDFAWPDKRIALEADGYHHWRPDTAIKDVARDAYLRSQGWLVLRVDDTTDTLENQLCRVAMVVNATEAGSWDWAMADAGDPDERARKAAKEARRAASEQRQLKRQAELEALAHAEFDRLNLGIAPEPI